MRRRCARCRGPGAVCPSQDSRWRRRWRRSRSWGCAAWHRTPRSSHRARHRQTTPGGALAQRAADHVGAGERPRAVALGTLQWDAQPEVEARLNGYLVSHSEYLGNGMRGMLPYARIVGYDSSDRR